MSTLKGTFAPGSDEEGCMTKHGYVTTQDENMLHNTYPRLKQEHLLFIRKNWKLKFPSLKYTTNMTTRRCSLCVCKSCQTLLSMQRENVTDQQQHIIYSSFKITFCLQFNYQSVQALCKCCVFVYFTSVFKIHYTAIFYHCKWTTHMKGNVTWVTAGWHTR